MTELVASGKAVLLVEDDQATAELELRVLTRNGIAVQRAAGVAEALALLRPTRLRLERQRLACIRNQERARHLRYSLLRQTSISGTKQRT